MGKECERDCCRCAPPVGRAIDKGCDTMCSTCAKVIQAAVCHTGENCGKGLCKGIVNANPMPKHKLLFELPATAAVNKDYAKRPVVLTINEKCECRSCCTGKSSNEQGDQSHACSKAFFETLKELSENTFDTQPTGKSGYCC